VRSERGGGGNVLLCGGLPLRGGGGLLSRGGGFQLVVLGVIRRSW